MVGGEAGACLGKQLGLRTSPSSLLRLARTIELSPQDPPTAIGLDDWAYKRRLRYGTLICDLDTGRPIELLPDRSIPTVSHWLQHHPQIKIVSRDRGGEYATAVQQGAPQALQVADRWHILQNLVDRATANSVTPRWHALLEISNAQTYCDAGDIMQSTKLARNGFSMAFQCHSPHQMNRVRKLLRKLESSSSRNHPGVQDLKSLLYETYIRLDSGTIWIDRR